MEVHKDMIGVEENKLKMKDLWADMNALQSAAEANQAIAEKTRKTIPEYMGAGIDIDYFGLI